MTRTATLTEISNSADAVWAALVVFEETHDVATARAALGTVSEADRRLFEEELAHEIAKLPPVERPAAPRVGRYCYTGPDFEGAILARQERDESRWT
jgi:hypothetical protein